MDRVQSYGADTFIVAYGSMFGASKSMAACVRDANLFCERMGKVMEPKDKHQKGGTAELIFMCR